MSIVDKQYVEDAAPCYAIQNANAQKTCLADAQDKVGDLPDLAEAIALAAGVATAACAFGTYRSFQLRRAQDIVTAKLAVQEAKNQAQPWPDRENLS